MSNSDTDQVPIVGRLIRLTIVCALFSISCTAIIFYWFADTTDNIELVLSISALVPTLITPVVGYAFFTLTNKLEAANEKLVELSETDPLTGINNRRKFNEIASKLFATTNRHHHPLSLLLLDLDRFKDINDKYGHPVGDRVLSGAVNIFQTCLREADVFARWGGEEFVFLLSDTNLEGALMLAERLRKTLQEQPIELGDQLLKVTVSVGGVTYLGGNSSFDDLFSRADELLYKSKHAGRNQIHVEVFSDMDDSSGVSQSTPVTYDT